ncbi:MAG: NAD-dependent epimerase/dehydratase family protein [Bacteroidota bacterium]
MRRDKILITGANGQIGTVLTKSLREIYGNDNVIATDIKRPAQDNHPFYMLDILNVQRLYEMIEDHKITQVYHLAAILSASGEWNPQKTWNVNMSGLLTVLEMARQKNIHKVFFPSTIAVFGKTTPRINTAQHVPMMPETVYGISKTTGELWCNYYFNKYGLDVRSVRYPGIIGYQSLPHGGTTDYAVEIFHKALENKSYACFLESKTRLPMLYMPDAIRGTVELMEANTEKISVRTSYNLAGMSFSPEEISDEIKNHIPEFKISYKPDFRQEIAASWTESIDDSAARNDWNWMPEYDLQGMTKDMIEKLSKSN